jgi:hypothetical protein
MLDAEKIGQEFGRIGNRIFTESLVGAKFLRHEPSPG